MDGEGSGMGVWSGIAPTCECKLKLISIYCYSY